MVLDVMEEYKNSVRQEEEGGSGRVDMPVDAIRIPPCFADHPPGSEKMEQKEQYFRETGALQSQIILDGDGNLIDGYTSYLLAVRHGIQSIPIRKGKRQIVRACHKAGGQSYMWELPRCLVDRVSTGDRVLVHTRKGVRSATVEAVEDYLPQKQGGPLRTAIRVMGKTGR